MQGRSSIHYGVFLVAGVLITGVSLFTLASGSAVSPEAMQLFAGIGVLFLAIGFGKYVIKKIRDVKEGERQLENRIAGVELKPKPTKTIIPCGRCGTNNYSTSNFCHMCGMRLQ